MDVIEMLGKLETNKNQVPEQQVVVSGCGEIKDGTEIPCQTHTKQAGPFGVSSLGVAGITPAISASSKPLFGSSAGEVSVNSFSFGPSGGAAGSTFSFGTPSSSGFGGGSFGASSQGTNTHTSPFGQNTSINNTMTNNPPFSFGTSNTAFGNSQAPNNPVFGFGKPSSS
jgi:hypothetical protein